LKKAGAMAETRKCLPGRPSDSLSFKAKKNFGARERKKKKKKGKKKKKKEKGEMRWANFGDASNFTNQKPKKGEFKKKDGGEVDGKTE